MFTAQNKLIAENILKSCLSKITDGKTYNIIIEEVKQYKTKKQLGFFFGGIAKALSAYYFELGYGIDENTSYDADTTKLIVYKNVLDCQSIETPYGDIIEKPIKTLSIMTMEEASAFISDTLFWVDEKTNCILPPALRYCWLLHIDENTIQRAKEYKFPNRDSSYANYIRSLPCIYCGKPHYNGVRSEIHHVKNVDKSCPDIIPPDWCGIPLCTDCHTGSARVQDMQPDKLKKLIPTYGFDMYMFLRLCYLRWLEHK